MLVSTTPTQRLPRPHQPTIHRVIRLGVTTLEETALVLRLGETALLHLREGALQVQVVVLSRVVAPVIRGLVRRRTARVAPAEVPRHVVGVVLTVGKVPRHLVVGVVVLHRSVLLPDR